MPKYPTAPTKAEVVRAERALVLAPHPDDEVLGCGGLLAQLVSAGCAVHVQVLTDGAGGVEAAPGADGDGSNDASYASSRAEEAKAVAAFGGWTVGFSGFPDGGLAQRGGDLSNEIRALLEQLEPDLILAPSPFEQTPDHVGAFEALFATLTELRTGMALHELAAGCRVLLYSVNQAGFPNCLVDVSEQVEWLGEAMAHYPSQTERHDYLGATVGLRRFRAHSLPAAVTAAEGYIALRLEDFLTQSSASLREALLPRSVRIESGPGEQRVHEVSLVVRTFNRPQLLREALESVAANILPPTRVIVVNDGGVSPRAEGILNDLPYEIRLLDLERNVGRSAAANAGIDAVAEEITSSDGRALVGFLDDDDVLFPEHLQTLVSALGAAEVGAAYSDAAVARYELRGPVQIDGRDGGGWVCVQRGLPYSRDFDPVRLLVDNYIPLHTLLADLELVQSLRFDTAFEEFEDWDFMIRLGRACRLHHVRRTTCEYRHFPSAGHHALGATADSSDRFLAAKAAVLEKHRDLLNSEQLAAAITGLRRETVERELEIADLNRRWESDRLARAHAVHEVGDSKAKAAVAEDRYQQIFGEVQSLRAEQRRLLEEHRQQGIELTKAYSELDRLADEIEQHTEHLQRTYAEIERLNELVRTMENSRAWRLRRLFERGS